MIAYGFSLGACHSSGADTEDSYRYCGKILWPPQREDYLPFPEGMEGSHSLQPSIAQAIEKQENHRVRFVYEDMAISYRVMQETVDMIIRQCTNDVCLGAGTLEESDSGVPLVVTPLPAADGRLIRESAPDREK